MDMSNMSQDLNDSWDRNVSFPCWPDEQPLQWTKILVLSTISILTLVFNSIILIAILSMKQKLSRMNYFLVQLSTADILTTALTLFPEIVWTATYPAWHG